MKRKAFLAGALAAGMAIGSPLGAQQRIPQQVLVILAHPDDEVFIAPALADAAADGATVTVVYATRGDAGPGVSDFAKGPALAAAREQEARCASEALGLAEPVFLDYGDGTLTTQAQDAGSGESALESELRTLIAQYRPMTIVTWGPAGGYGHADHRIVSALVTEIVQQMDLAEGAPQLLYPGIPDGTLPPVPEMQRWATTSPELLTLEAPYDSDELAMAGRAVQCHVTQFDAQTRTQMIPLFDQSIWQGAVHFRPAFGRSSP